MLHLPVCEKPVFVLSMSSLGRAEWNIISSVDPVRYHVTSKGIAMTLHERRVETSATQLFLQKLDDKTTKYPSFWLFVGESTGVRWIPSQRARIRKALPCHHWSN